ncbi:MAG: hypothetical protein ACE5HF_05300 [Gemmatimonadota bacterium]
MRHDRRFSRRPSRGSRAARRAVRRAAAAIVLIGWAAGPLAAQESFRRPEPPTPKLQLSVFGGALTPLPKLNDDGTNSAELSATVGGGAELDAWLANGFGIGVQAWFSSPDVTRRTIDPTSRFPVPTELGSVDYIAATINLMYRPHLTGAAAIIRPYFAIGGGLRRLDFEPIAVTVGEDETSAVGTIAAGAHVALWEAVSFRFEARDYLSSFDSTAFPESKLQNDLVVTAGIGVALR